MYFKDIVLEGTSYNDDSAYLAEMGLEFLNDPILQEISKDSIKDAASNIIAMIDNAITWIATKLKEIASWTVFKDVDKAISKALDNNKRTSLINTGVIIIKDQKSLGELNKAITGFSKIFASVAYSNKHEENDNETKKIVDKFAEGAGEIEDIVERTKKENILSTMDKPTLVYIENAHNFNKSACRGMESSFKNIINGLKAARKSLKDNNSKSMEGAKPFVTKSIGNLLKISGNLYACIIKSEMSFVKALNNIESSEE